MSEPGRGAREDSLANGDGKARPSRLHQFFGSTAGKWAAGVGTAVLTAVIIGWLTRWGFIPGAGSDSETTPSAEPPAVPFTVAVSTFQDPCGVGWVVPGAPSELPATDFDADDGWDSWITLAGGIPASPGSVSVTVQGLSDAAVTITNIRARVLERQEAPAGTHVYQRCGDLGAFRLLVVELDSDPPQIRDVYDADFAEVTEAPPQEKRPIKLPYIVDLAAPETFLVYGVTETCLCTWQLEMSWSSEGRTGTYVVGEERPFQTAATANAGATCIKTAAEPLACS